MSSLRALPVLLAGLWLTSVHADPRRIPGTSVALAPPVGFEPSQQFPGFVRPRVGAAIIVQEIGAPFPKVRAQVFDVDDLAARRIKVLSSEKIRLSGHDGVLDLVLREKDGAEQWILGMGDAKRTVLIFATCPAHSPPALVADLRKAVFSIRWPVRGQASPFEGLHFRITETGQLKISNRVGNALVLTDPSAPTPARPTDAILVVGSAPSVTSVGSLTESMLEELARHLMAHGTSWEDVQNMRGSRSTLRNLPAYELTADARGPDGRTPVRLYQLLLLQAASGRYYFVRGMVGAAQSSRVIPEFRAVARSLTPEP